MVRSRLREGRAADARDRQTRGRGAASWAAVAALLPVALGGCAARPEGAAPCADCNVLLVSIDTLRADHLHTYGYPRATSPFLDRLATQSAVFEQVVNTGGGTLPVHATMFTSVPPTEHDVWPEATQGLAGRFATLAELLRDAGYETRAYTGGGYVHSSFGLAQGFASFDDAGGNFAVELPKLERWLRDERPRDRPFFVFLHTYDAHSATHRLPYDPPAAFRDAFTGDRAGAFSGCRWQVCASEMLKHYNALVLSGRLAAEDAFPPEQVQYLRDLYDGGILYVDHALEGLFATLADLGLLETTLVVVTGDHGEEFLDHRLFLHDQNTEEILRVPLFVRAPGGRAAGGRFRDLASTLDVAPTILAAVGVEPDPAMEGRNLLPADGAPLPALHAVYVAHAAEKLRTARWSLFVAPDGTPASLYDLEVDPRETHDVLRENVDLARRLSRVLGLERARQRARRMGEEARARAIPSAEERAKLRALGY